MPEKGCGLIMSARMTRTQRCPECGRRVRDLQTVQALDSFGRVEDTMLMCRACAPEPKKAPALEAHSKLESRRGWWKWLRKPESHLTSHQKKAMKITKAEQNKRRGPRGRGSVVVTSGGSKIGVIKHRNRRRDGVKR